MALSSLPLTLSAGTRLGPYEIVAAIGAGGMGEVYRARDPRIGREVAIKVLPAALTQDPERLRRFEQEARATGTLSHPNLLTVFDVGNEQQRPFLVSELLEGLTLREAMAGGRLSPRKAIDYATQIANGMAAAHAKGIVHRDLKPENIFVTTEGRVKLLDFGLAKFIENDDAGDAATEVKTSPGVVIGTTAYMSPEQVRGGAVDHRSDIFSFGVVLYEMLAGAHPFRRETAVETMNAILRDEPPPIADAAVPPGLLRVIEHAVEKTPSNRFESMKDLAFALGALTISGESSPSRPQRARKSAAESKPKEPQFERITFRRGFIMSARFAPDGTIVYGAAWEDKAVEVFAAHPSTPESQSLLADADVLSVSPTGELALSLGRRYFAGWATTGTLARRPIGGGAPRVIAENVQEAEWTRDGRSLLIVRQAGGLYRIESPIDNVLYQSALWLSRARLSPRGDLIAFVEHPIWGDDGGRVIVIDAQGQEKVRSTFWSSTGGVAWTPKGDEVVVGAESGKRLVAINMNGRERTLLTVPGRLTLHDIGKDGSVLVTMENGRREAMAGRIGQPQDRNLSWFDWTWITDVSNDGKLLLLAEQASAVRGQVTVYVRPTDGGEAVRIGEGFPRGRAFSPDGKSFVMQTANGLELVPVGAGSSRILGRPKLETCLAWQPFPDGRRLLILGHTASAPLSLYEMVLDGDGSVQPLSGTTANWPLVLSNDGTTATATGYDDRPWLYPLGGEARPAPGCNAGEFAIGWTPDDRAIYVYRRGRVTVPIERVDITSGQRTPWHTITPPDPAGILDIMPILITPDGQTYVYGFRRFLSDLHVVRGLL